MLRHRTNTDIGYYTFHIAVSDAIISVLHRTIRLQSISTECKFYPETSLFLKMPYSILILRQRHLLDSELSYAL